MTFLFNSCIFRLGIAYGPSGLHPGSTILMLSPPSLHQSSPSAHLPSVSSDGYTFLKAADIERLITDNKFEETDTIEDVHLLHFKHDRFLLLKLPSNLCEKNPRDGYLWNKIKYNKDKKIEYRHQPTYTKIEIFGEKVTCLRCTEFNHPDIRKQVFAYKDHTYCYYFASGVTDIAVYDTSSKKLDKVTKDQLRTTVMPMRTVSDAVKVARGMGIHVSRKQLANLARSTSGVIFQKTGPRSKTTLAMAQDLKRLHPDRVWFEHNGASLLTDLTYIQIFEEGCRIYFNGCPTKTQYDDWLQRVEALLNSDSSTRKREIKQILSTKPNGVVFPSRLHVDTTFNLGDVFVTFILGETSKFKTKRSLKPRVVPVAYMLHSSKRSENHLKFAEALKAEFDKLQDSSSPRHIPCILLDGESSLQHYSEVLCASAIRCDVHILSLLRFDHGGRKAALHAKPLLFGRMKNGTWRTGLLGCFDVSTFDQRLRRIKDIVDPKIAAWLESNKMMLMESSSAIAKLRGGHLLQFSTNNQNETFNGIIKTSLPKSLSAPDLIRKLDECCHEKFRECWLSAIDGSELVFFTADVDEADLEDRIEAYSSSGLLASRTLALNVPLRIAEGLHIVYLLLEVMAFAGFDLQKVNQEERACSNLRFMNKSENMFHLEDTTKHDRSRYVHVKVLDDFMIECWTCVKTLPAHLCSHVIFVLCRLEQNHVDAFWSRILGEIPRPKPVNAFSGRSGLKLSDRIGSKQSARNHVRTITNISSMTFESDASTISVSAPSTPQNVSLSSQPSTSEITPGSSVERRSQRSRKPFRKYTPPHDITDDSIANSTIY